MPETDELAAYIGDNYGHCVRQACDCLHRVWLGSVCPNWRGVTATNWEELRELMRKRYA